MNEKRLITCFKESLAIDEVLIHDGLEYGCIPEWDSIAHMTLIANIEDEFDLMLDTDDIIDLSSFKVAKEILSKHNIIF